VRGGIEVKEFERAKPDRGLERAGWRKISRNRKKTASMIAQRKAEFERQMQVFEERQSVLIPKIGDDK
jgi:hypothetical protein